VAAAGRRDVRLGEALRRARPGPAAEGRLSLRVPRADAMARSTLERREMVLAFRHAAEEVLGLDLVPAVESVVEAVPAPTGGAATAALREHPLVQAVAEATGGRLLQAERTSPPAAAPGE
jgi:hypothetical protein